MIKEFVAVVFIVAWRCASVSVLAQKGSREVKHAKPFVVGVIDNIQSEVLSEKRVFNVYLPDGYNKNDIVSYPVVDLLGALTDKDFSHTIGLHQFNSFPRIHSASFLLNS